MYKPTRYLKHIEDSVYVRRRQTENQKGEQGWRFITKATLADLQQRGQQFEERLLGDDLRRQQERSRIDNLAAMTETSPTTAEKIQRDMYERQKIYDILRDCTDELTVQEVSGPAFGRRLLDKYPEAAAKVRGTLEKPLDKKVTDELWKSVDDMSAEPSGQLILTAPTVKKSHLQLILEQQELELENDPVSARYKSRDTTSAEVVYNDEPVETSEKENPWWES
jgi:hypothetical protein